MAYMEPTAKELGILEETERTLKLLYELGTTVRQKFDRRAQIEPTGSTDKPLVPNILDEILNNLLSACLGIEDNIKFIEDNVNPKL